MLISTLKTTQQKPLESEQVSSKVTGILLNLVHALDQVFFSSQVICCGGRLCLGLKCNGDNCGLLAVNKRES